MTDQQKPLYFFLHIPKTGGTSLSDLLDRIYAPRYVRVMHSTNRENWERVASILQNEPDRYDAIGTHVAGFGIHTVSARPVRYVTVLREPAARVISLYYKIIRNEDDRRHDQFQQYEDVAEGLQHLGVNLQTRVIAGVPPAETVTAEHLAVAKRNLETWFDGVAILERFEESLIVMRRALGWKRPVMTPPRSNVGKNRPKTLPESVRQMARDLNSLDGQLYVFANELLDRRIRELGFTYRRDLMEMRARRMVSRLKSAVRRGRAKGTSSGSLSSA